MLLTRPKSCALLLLGLLLWASAAMAADTAPAPPSWAQLASTSTATLTSLQLSFGKSPDDHAGASDVVSYRIFSSPEGQAAVYLTPVTASGAATYQRIIAGLIPGTRYRIGVQAFDGALSSTPIILFATAFYLPPPVNLILSDPPDDNGTTLDLQFSRSTADATGGPVTSYLVYKRLGTGAFAQVKTIPATHANSYKATITGLTKGVSVSLGIRACDGPHTSPTLTGSLAPQDTVAPAPPRNLVLLNPAADDGTTMQLRFANSLDDAVGKDVTLYRLYRKTTSTQFSLVGTAKATRSGTYWYTFTGLTKGARYCFAAAAYDGTNESTREQVWGDSSAPEPARNLSVTDTPADTGTALEVTFDRSLDDGSGALDVTQYHVYKRATATTTTTRVATIAANGSASYAYTVTGLTRDVNTLITVYAWDGYQASVPVAKWATPKDNIPPAPATGLAVLDWPSDDGKSLKITFKRSPDDAGATPKTTAYWLYRAPWKSSDGTKIATIAATKAASYQYKDTGLVAGKKYWYRVVATGPMGAAADSARVSGIPVDNRYVRPPSRLTAKDHPYDHGGVIDLTWVKSGDDGAGAKIVTKYYIYRKMANPKISPTKIATVTANGAAKYKFSDKKVPLELVYYDYTVRAVAANGAKSAPSNRARASAADNNVLVFQAPSGLTVKDVIGGTGGQLQLSWRRSVSEGDVGPPPPPPVVHTPTKVNYGGQYEFYRRTSSTTYGTLPTFSVSASGTTNPMTYRNSGLRNGTRYYYKVRYRRYNQISAFTAEASATPVKRVVASAETTASDEGTSAAVKSADAGLTVSLLSPPARVLVGQDVLIGLKVHASGRSAACLEYAVGASLARTAAVTGEGSYETPLKLRTSGLPVGTTVLVRAIVAEGGATAASEVSALTIVAP